MLALDGETLDKLTDMDEAFNLLLRPLTQHLPLDQQVVLLIDAIDEADPLDQQQGDGKRSFQPMSNQAVRLIVNCLSTQLPRNVRFIFTTRQVWFHQVSCFLNGFDPMASCYNPYPSDTPSLLLACPGLTL